MSPLEIRPLLESYDIWLRAPASALKRHSPMSLSGPAVKKRYIVPIVLEQFQSSYAMKSPLPKGSRSGAFK